ncbi:MAG: sulfotransferase family protein [Gammaproteobacteria bacterium]
MTTVRHPGRVPRAVIVVGASRSGTSVVAHGLETLGVDLGARLRHPSWRNPRGFFEDRALLNLSARLRRTLGLGPHSVSLIDPERWNDPRLSPLKRQAMALLREGFDGRALWGFKDGRTLRLLPFWRDVFDRLDLDVRYVLVIRNPLSVAASRLRIESGKPVSRRFTPELLWLVYVVPYFRCLAERPLVVVDYDRMMARPVHELARIAAGLGLAFPGADAAPVRAFADEFLSSSLRHSEYDDNDLVRRARFPAITLGAYRWLRRLATDDATPDDRALDDDWRRYESVLQGMADDLRRIDARNRALRGVRINPGAILRRLAG